MEAVLNETCSAADLEARTIPKEIRFHNKASFYNILEIREGISSGEKRHNAIRLRAMFNSMRLLGRHAQRH